MTLFSEINHKWWHVVETIQGALSEDGLCTLTNICVRKWFMKITVGNTHYFHKLFLNDDFLSKPYQASCRKMKFCTLTNIKIPNSFTTITFGNWHYFHQFFIKDDMLSKPYKGNCRKMNVVRWLILAWGIGLW